MSQKYETLIRAKGMFDDCETVAQMAERAESMGKQLREMAAAGVVVREKVVDDYPFLTTTDQKVAERFGFRPEEKDDDSEE